MQTQKPYTARFTVSIVLYAIFLAGSLIAMKWVEPLWARALLAVLPVVPVSFAFSAIIDGIRVQDEFQQRINLEAAVFSLVGTGLATFTYGFLENAGFPPIGLIWVLPLSIALWGIGGALARRRYG
jgi:hypothetical protein